MLAVLLLVPASLVAGCVAEPSSQLTLRQGDLARVELVVWNGNDTVLPRDAATVEELCGATPDASLAACPSAERAYALRGTPPAQAPSAWADASPLPDPLIDLLEGTRTGETIHRQDLAAFGPHRPGLVEEHALEGAVSRFVDDPRAYGRTWNTTLLDNGTHRIEPEVPEGTTLEVDRWCNERFCLFESALAGHDERHLFVRHGAQEGQAVHVPELDTRLRVTSVDEASFTVDGNPRHAGERFDVFAHVTEARGPPEGAQRAPDFAVNTLNGTSLELSELLDRPIVLEFFATWCPSCAENADHLAEVRDRFGNQVRIVSIGVDPWEKPDAFRSFAREHDVTWPIAVDEDGEIAQAYGVGSLSTEIVVSEHGAIVHTETGVADHERVVGVLEAQLAHDHHGHAHAGDAPGAEP